MNIVDLLHKWIADRTRRLDNGRSTLDAKILNPSSPRGLHLLFVVVSALVLSAAGGQNLPKVSLSYKIGVRLEPETRKLSGQVNILWNNASEQSIDAVPLHLYLNAFAHEQTTWMRSSSSWGREVVTELLGANQDPWGYTEPTGIRQRVAGEWKQVEWKAIQPDDGNLFDRSLIQVQLTEPLLPGQNMELQVDFAAQMPIPISRTGGEDDYFMVAQWYPKLGVFETPGVRHAKEARWAARQFHGTTEFYADFADYDVSVHVPKGWSVVATGEVVSKNEETDVTTFRVQQRAIHDFAFVAGKNLHQSCFMHKPRGEGAKVNVCYLMPKGTQSQIPRWRKAIEGAMDILGARVGPYPYDHLFVVLPPWRDLHTCGMEYPTLINGLPGDPLWDRFPFVQFRVPEGTLVHEFAHQYFYGLVASNEQEEAFLDEGFTTYWHLEIMEALFGRDSSLGYILGRPLSLGDRQAKSVA
ncbi:MAG: M1 family aminopeptidase, partial [Pseudomonadota bacterium]